MGAKICLPIGRARAFRSRLRGMIGAISARRIQAALRRGDSSTAAGGYGDGRPVHRGIRRCGPHPRHPALPLSSAPPMAVAPLLNQLAERA